MKIKFSERLAALFLSLVMVLSCCVPYGFAAEIELLTDAEAVETVETDDAEAIADAEAVETVETDDAEAVADAEAVESDAESADFAILNDGKLTNLTDFSSFNHAEDDLLHIDPDAHTVTLDFVGGDHFVVYNGLDHKVNSFVWEADVDIQTGLKIQSAALIFGFPSKEAASSNWYGANLDSTRLGGEQAFRLFGPNVDTNSGGSADGIDITKTLHLKVDVHATGDFVYSFGNAGQTLKEITGHISGWKGGYLGILTWESGATFSNISLEEREETIPPPTFGKVTVTDGFKYNNNIAAADLSDLSTEGSGVWEARADGLYSNAVGQGDAFLYSETTGGNFVYSTDVKFAQEHGAAALLFRNADANGHDESYAVNIDAGSKRAKMWRWEDGMDYQLSGQIEFEPEDSYTLKVVFIDAWLSFYVNGKLIGSTGDYHKLGGADWGQDTYIQEGTFGLLNWDGEMTFNNTVYTPITGNFTPLLSDISVTSSGTVEEKGQFVSTEPTIIQYVGNDASTVDINATPVSGNAVVKVYGPDGKECADGKNIPVAVGANYIAVESSVTNGNATAIVTYRVNVHRRQEAAIYYNELYRDQYHYSVKDGWANDPNGLVYYNGTYHFFYQFYDDLEWGPMHWAHATSTDLVHWTDAPMAFYPDANGSMFSGCIVVDDKNTSGLFSGDNGGLVALITANGNGQRIKVAYSTDEGKTWTKVSKIAADWTDDPLYSRDFRDPKVFRWENKWFMVIAGGPLRIYSSDNLREWKCESTYATLHTECPDLYPIQADDGVKWVLSRGGRRYKVGDFKEVYGKWRFVPDAAYAKEADNGIMNFGKDSYAAMTYYVQDFGTAANPTLPDIVELNWMNTWDDYCRAVARTVGQAFNGTFNLNLKLGLKNVNGTYVLTQTPIEAYKDLRGAAAVTLTNAQVTENNNLLSDFSGDCYEIVATFRPGDAKRVGFDLRVGEGQKTAIRYDTESKLLSIDRSQSGIIISNMFKQVDSQTVEPNDDGSIDLHIYVDRASVEAFAKGYTVAGANQIFPSISSRGAAIVAEGGTASADVTIYPLQSAWTDKVTTDTPMDIVVSGQSDIRVNVGDEVNLQATLLPVNVPQNIRWTVSGDAGVISGNDSGNNFHGKAEKAGSATITATAVDNASLTKTFKVTVAENNFETNIPAFTVINGNWFINDKTLSVSNQSDNYYYLSSNPVALGEFTLETNIRYTKGLINIFFAAGGHNVFGPQAYALQFGDGESIRLFRFGGEDFAPSVNMGKRVNDGQFHNVKITKTSNSVAISVDGVDYPACTLESVEACYNTGTYVGIGLWDGALDVQTFNVTEIAAEPEPQPVYRTVKFEANGGSGSMKEEQVEDGKDFTLPQNGFTPPANKKFKAWGIGSTQYNPGALLAITGDTTLTALWDDVPVTPAPTPGGSGGSGSGKGGGCYVATAVYGSYDCPEVWTLRRFRDNVLAKTWYGRLFIKLYYAISPTAVRLFGDADWFQSFWRGKLDSMVSNLQADGFESTPYEDKAW